MTITKKIHFIGIGGTAMAALAVAFKRAGFIVTGSDSGNIFPPMSTHLKKNGIKYGLGFKEKNLGQPNEVVLGNAHVSNLNPEIAMAKKRGLPIIHFPRLIEKYLIKKNSVVVAGTYGKTTITAMAAWLLEKAGKNPNYMLGGIPIDLENGARLIKSDWSVTEGDEYPAASPWDSAPKFKYYHPKFLILTSAEWDHMDVYKTKESYLEVFRKLVASVPENGLIVAKAGGENLAGVLKGAKCKIIYYSNQKLENRNQDEKLYYISGVEVIGDKTKFIVKKRLSAKINNHPRSVATERPLLEKEGMTTTVGEFETKLLGEFNLENWCAAVALAIELRIPLKKIQAGVKSFSGVKRRLEIRGVKKGVTIIDDFAHNPAKARQSVLALRRHFPKNKIYVIFEPNRGGRSEKCLSGYNKVFAGITKVFISKLTEYPPKKGVKDVSGKELVKYLKKTHGGVTYEPETKELINKLKKIAKSGDVIAFLGSRNFGGVLERLLSS
ncbi:MAG: Mur ligase family protein [Patescibacteria group bacterium]|nr:Mur ligase family protein [Patescibacteria group bacterium]